MLAAASASTLTPERTTALVAVGLAVSGAILGGMAFARAKRVVTGGRRLMAAAALILGGCGLLLGGRVIVAARGELGTGRGSAGGIVAIVLGATAAASSGMALARLRRAG